MTNEELKAYEDARAARVAAAAAPRSARSWKPICIVAAMATVALIGWPMAKDAAAEKMNADALAHSRFAHSPLGATLGVTIGPRIVRARLEKLPVIWQVVGVTAELLGAPLGVSLDMNELPSLTDNN